MKDIADLSFVASRDGVTLPKAKRGQLPRCFWFVQPSGDYEKDCKTGQRLALEFLELAEVMSHPCLGWIVADMPRPFTGVEIGFLTVVSLAARAGAHEGRRVVAYWDKMEKANAPT